MLYYIYCNLNCKTLTLTSYHSTTVTSYQYCCVKLLELGSFKNGGRREAILIFHYSTRYPVPSRVFLASSQYCIFFYTVVLDIGSIVSLCWGHLDLVHTLSWVMDQFLGTLLLSSLFFFFVLLLETLFGKYLGYGPNDSRSSCFHGSIKKNWRHRFF